MLIRKLIETCRADAGLATDIRAALIESLFAPIASLILGAIGCSIIGAAVALRVGDYWLMANSIAIFAVGILRVVSALLYKKYKKSQQLAATKLWERVYEYGAWAFSAQSGVDAAAPTPNQLSNTAALGALLYTRYVYAFQAAGMILLVAMIGAIVLTLRTRPGVRRQVISVQNARTAAMAVEMVDIRPGEGA